MDRQTLTQAVTLLCAAFGRDSSDALFDAYAAALSDLPGPALLPACRDLLTREEWMPPPARVRRAVEQRVAEAALRDRPALPPGDVPGAQPHRDLVAALGLREADQGTWQALRQARPPLPPLFRRALFCPPEGDGPAAVIFPEPGDATRARSTAYRATHRLIAARVALACLRPGGLTVHYLDAPWLLAQLGAGDDPGRVA